MITPSQGARILIVDDDPGILRAVSRILGRGHQVATALAGPEALHQARHWRPDLAIVDIRLPDMNGFEVTRSLKADRRDIDVILMTGNPEEPDENLIRAIDEGAFYFIQKPFDRGVLLTLVNRCLELRRLREERERYLRRVEQELAEARRFQLSLLPPARYEQPGLAIAARYLACHELAGDFYDYVTTDEQTLSLLIADVVGHGTSAAMLTGVVKAAFRASHVDRYQPLAVVDRVREGLRDFDESRFVTLCTACIDLGSGEIRYANAGHPHPILRRASSETVLLEPTGPVLSSGLCDLPCAQDSLRLEPGDSLLLYTDGLIEAWGPSGAFGQHRLVHRLTECPHSGMELLDHLLAEVSSYSGSAPHRDDITLLTVNFGHA
jgi:sigma-B regulation protein RsbU (phosphoserine phosphatase)